MSTNEMRAVVMKAYSSVTWERKVRLMGENQVIAIYYKLLNNKQI